MLMHLLSVLSIIVLSASLWEHPKHVQAGNNLRLNQRLFPLAVHHRQVKGTANEIPTRTAGAVQAKIKAHVHTHTRSHTHKDQMYRVNKMMGGN